MTEMLWLGQKAGDRFYQTIRRAHASEVDELLYDPTQTIESLAVREGKNTDCLDFRSVAMKPINHDTGQACHIGFERDEIANTGFIKPATIVYNDNVAALGLHQRFKKDIHAACVARGQHATRATHTLRNWSQPRWTTANLNAHTHARIRQMRSRQSVQHRCIVSHFHTL